MLHHLIFLAYMTGSGAFDNELIEISFTHGLYCDLVFYLIERQDPNFWGKVLKKDCSGTDGDDNPQRRKLIHQVVNWDLSESTLADQVSCTVNALLAAYLPEQVNVFLERVILQGFVFADNKNLQEMLIRTAIRVYVNRVAGYIDRLDNFDAEKIALVCV